MTLTRPTTPGLDHVNQLSNLVATFAVTMASCSDHQGRSRLVAAPVQSVAVAADAGVGSARSPTVAALQSSVPTPMRVTELDTGCPQPLRVSVVHEGAERSSLVLLEAILPRAGDDDPDSRELTRSEALAAGATDSDDPVWVYSQPDAPPCQATPGAFVMQSRSPGGPPYLELVRELHGCPAPPNETAYLALRRHTRSDRCLLRAALEVTAAPTATALIRRVGLARSCRAPRCESSTAVRSAIFDNGSAVHDIEVVYRFPRGDEAPCESRYHYAHAVAWVPAAGSAPVRIDRLGFVTGGFYDASGMRALVADRLGVVTVLTAPIDAARAIEPAQRITWYLAPEGSGRDGKLEPSCH